MGQVWTTAMLGLWSAGLWTLKVVLVLEDGLLTPDLSEAGPAAAAYRVTFWMAGALAGLLLVVQIGVVLLRRDARSLGAALWGCGKFVVVWAAWLAYGAAVVGVCGGLTRALLRELLHVQRWAEWQPSLLVRPETVVDASVATVLGLLGLVLWLAALGHVGVMVTRAGTLLVLAAVTPVAAAGLVGEAGRSWFWKSVRWFHAAALTPVLMVLLIGVGVQTTTGVASGLAAGPALAVGTALPGVLLIVVSCFAPLALFRLLAFVDPATPAGIQVRQTIDTLLQGRSLLNSPGSASSSDPSPTTDGTTDQDPGESRRADAESQLDLTGQSPTPGAARSTTQSTGSPPTSGAADPDRAGSTSRSDAATAPPTAAPSSSPPSGPAPSGPPPSSPPPSSPAPSGSTPSGLAPSGPASSSPAPLGPGSSSSAPSGRAGSGGAGGGVSGGSAGGSVTAEAAALPVVPV